MWKTPQRALTPILFAVAGLCMIAAGLLRPNEGWVTVIMYVAGALFLINALLQAILRKREQDERDN